MNQSTDGGIHLSVEIRIDAEKMATWPPHLVSIFMRGIAEILAAHSEATKDGGHD